MNFNTIKGVAYSRQESRGFALFEAMIAVSMIAISTAGMLAVMSNFANMQLLAEIKNEITNQVFELRVALSDPRTCKANFAGVTLTGGTTAISRTLHPLQVGSEDALDLATRLTPPPGSGVRVAAVGYRLIQTPVTKVYQLEVQFASEARLATQSFYRNISMSVDSVDGVTTDCNSAGGIPNTAGLCRSFNGAYDASSGKCDVIGPVCAKLGGQIDGGGNCTMPSSSNSNMSCQVMSGQATGLSSSGVVMGTGNLPVGDYGKGVVSVAVSCGEGKKMIGLDCSSAEGQHENSSGFSAGHCYGTGPAGPNAFPINYNYLCCDM